MSNSSIISIDPGVSGTGYAVWDEKRWDFVVPPTHVGIVPIPKNIGWMPKCLEIVSAVDVLVGFHNCRKVYIEYPAYHQSNAGQMIARRGDLVKLTFLAGMIAGRIHAHPILIPVMTWKGQLPKNVIEYRIKKVLGEKACATYKSHIWDAVGIGLFAKGKL